jgi:hypothetical protein
MHKNRLLWHTLLMPPPAVLPLAPKRTDFQNIKLNLSDRYFHLPMIMTFLAQYIVHLKSTENAMW